MALWLSTPTIPGYTIELGHQDEGERQRHDLLVHPIEMRPHHVAIRIYTENGRDPILFVGFGAEARPVCLPEHLGPQQATVDAALELLLPLGKVGEGLASQLRNRWHSVHSRLKSRHDEFVHERQAQCRFVVGGAGQPILLCEPTRPFAGSKPFGMAMNRGRPAYCGISAWRSPPLNERTVRSLAFLSDQEKQELISAPQLMEGALRDAFVHMGQEPVFAIPISLDRWIAFGRLPHVDDDWLCPKSLVEAVGSDGSTVWVSMDRGADLDAPQTEQTLRLHGMLRDPAAEIIVSIGNRQVSNGELHPIEIQYSGGVGSDIGGAMRRLIAVYLGFDPDFALAPVSGRPSLQIDQLKAHPVTKGLEIQTKHEQVVSSLLGSKFGRLLKKANGAGQQSGSR